MIKKIVFFTLIYICLDSHSQDPSFSQSDLGSIYMNPAYTGASGHPKFLSIRREQWKNYNIPSDGELNGNFGGIRPFTTSLAEFSVGLDAGNDGRVGLRTIGIGASLMAEDHLLAPELLSNTIFLTRSDYQIYLSGLFKIANTRSLFGKVNRASVIHYVQPAISYGQSVYGLQTEGIVTSDMLTPYTLSYDYLPDPTINIQDLAINRKPFHKLVFGLLWSAQGNTNTTKYNKTESGLAIQRMSEGFNNNTLTSKIILHSNHKGSFNTWNIKMIRYWNIFSKREIYYSEEPLSDKILAKTEIGGSIEIGRYSPIELGNFIRFTGNYEKTRFNQLNWQTICPFVRLNFRGRRHAFLLSWSNDIESTFFNNPKNNLSINNTGITNEICLSILFWGGKGPKECIEYGTMKNNGLLQDLKK